MPKSKRYRRRTAKPGQLLAYYGKMPKDSPDVIFAWGGSGASKCDSNLLYSVIASPRMFLNSDKAGQVDFDISLLDELEKRGYDIATLQFSIQMKPKESTGD